MTAKSGFRQHSDDLKANMGKMCRFWIGFEVPLAKRLLAHCEKEECRLSEYVRHLVRVGLEVEDAKAKK